MMRYDIEETAVYDKYVRWCGRTGPRGPSYPILARLRAIVSRAECQPAASAAKIVRLWGR